MAIQADKIELIQTFGKYAIFDPLNWIGYYPMILVVTEYQ